MAGHHTAALVKGNKPHSSAAGYFRNTTWLLIPILCVLSYAFGVWQYSTSRTTTFPINTKAVTAATNCPNPKATAAPLDFKSHHSQDDVSDTTGSVKTYEPCDMKYSEYTPCEDVERSLRFNRDRLIYRERHCPEKNETLKCRIPAPHGYKNPFRWPMSRNLAWYANVPHKELTVEKAVQNWIRFEGDRFRFPGGGTMFPNGADAYIDDIGKLINLKDGSIRTAIDTGCGVRNLWSLTTSLFNLFT